MLRTLFLFGVGFLVAGNLCLAQTRQPAFDMNARLGRGINMGNCFEAPTETEWGNPWKPEYFKIMADLGFDHVRLPVQWETSARSMETPPYTIDASLLNRIETVIQTALKNKLHIVVNMHHHEALFANPAAQKDRFLSQWSQIAERFKNYPDSLLFEVMNEPHGNVTPAVWNEYFADALTEIRKTNPTRVVLMGVAEYGGPAAISQLQLPDDEYIILTPHYYNPFTFTHQGAEWVDGANAWLGTQWLGTDAERETVMSDFNYALHFSEVNHIPIHVGEFGAYNKADALSRERWSTFLSRWFEEKNISWAYWEFSAGFGIYNPANNQRNQGLVNALTQNDMPEATTSYSRPVYSSNFAGDVDGWFLSAQGGAAGNLTSSDSKLEVAITSGGTEGWHLQLLKTPIYLKQNKRYKLSFSAKAQADRSLTFYAGKASDPWTAYSGANAVSISTAEATYVSTFTMTSPTDEAARFVFDLGKNTNGVTISEVKVEELSLSPISGIGKDFEQKPTVYPNPISSYVGIENSTGYDRAELLDVMGRSYGAYGIIGGGFTLREGEVPAGLYILSLSGEGCVVRIKVVKN